MGDDPAGPDGVVERYLRCLAAHDWEGLAATIADEGLVREGPFCDVVEGKQPYLDFLRRAVAPLVDHELAVQRISHTSGRACYVELLESFRLDDTPTSYPECLVFEQNDAGLICRVSVFMKQPAGPQRRT